MKLSGSIQEAYVRSVRGRNLGDNWKTREHCKKERYTDDKINKRKKVIRQDKGGRYVEMVWYSRHIIENDVKDIIVVWAHKERGCKLCLETGGRTDGGWEKD